MIKNLKIRHSMYLLLAAFIWGMAFVSQSKGMDYMGPLTFNGVRSLIGAAVLALYLLVRQRLPGGKRDSDMSREQARKPLEQEAQFPEPGRRNGNPTLAGGICCGLVLTAASTLQQMGLQYTTVGKAGFITTLYIIFVPVMGVFFHRKVSGIVWLGAAMAAVGMYLLCMTESLSLKKGDLLVLSCALVFTGHILLVDHFSPRADGVRISCIQFAVCGVLCTAGALIWEKPALSQLWEGVGTLAYAGVLSCGVAYTLQIVGQRDVNPSVAALLLSMESVFAAVSAWIAYEMGFLKEDQTMTGRQLAGCTLVFTAVILVQICKSERASGASANSA